MSDFNFNKYLKNNPLLKETSGYGNYTKPETMLEDNDYISGEEYDNMTDDEIDAAELAGRLEPRDKPLGPDEELMEADTLSKSILNGVNSLKAKGLSNDEIMEVCQMSLDQLSSKSIIPQAMAFLKKHTLHGGIQIMQGIADLMDQGLSYGEILDVCEGNVYTEDLMEDKESSEKDSKVKKQVIEKLSKFFDVSTSALNKFKFDGTDDIKQLTKALGGTNTQGIEHVVRIAISSSKKDL